MPIPDGLLAKVQADCAHPDDEPRWLIAIISDSLMRLSECCGLTLSDRCLACALPHIKFVVHAWRRLKDKLKREADPNSWRVYLVPRLLEEWLWGLE